MPRRRSSCTATGTSTTSSSEGHRPRAPFDDDMFDHTNNNNSDNNGSGGYDNGKEVVSSKKKKKIDRQTITHHKKTQQQRKRKWKQKQKQKKERKQTVHQTTKRSTTTTAATKLSEQHTDDDDDDASDDKTNSNTTTNILYWESPVDYIPIQEEERMVHIMMERNGAKERGMMKDKPSFVYQKFVSSLHQYAPTMTLSQVFSLRRHHIKLSNPYGSMAQLRLGQEQDIRVSAQLFEDCIEEYIQNSIAPSVQYLTESDQRRIRRNSSSSSRRRGNNNDNNYNNKVTTTTETTVSTAATTNDIGHQQQQFKRFGATPDFVFPAKEGIILRKIRYHKQKNRKKNNPNKNNNNGGNNSDGNNNTNNSNTNTTCNTDNTTKNTKKTNTNYRILEERTIYWIEAKMYYGASTIPPGNKNGACGSLLQTATKYVHQFGPGAFVFMMGCGDKLAHELNSIGCSVLDCSMHSSGTTATTANNSNNSVGGGICLDKVHKHQQTWCGNKKGQILP